MNNPCFQNAASIEMENVILKESRNIPETGKITFDLDNTSNLKVYKYNVSQCICIKHAHVIILRSIRNTM